MRKNYTNNFYFHFINESAPQILLEKESAWYMLMFLRSMCRGRG